MTAVRRTLAALLAAVAVTVGLLGTTAAPASALTTSTLDWSTGFTFEPLGKTLTLTGSVTTEGAPRTVNIQARLSGAASWSTYSVVSTSPTGQFTQQVTVVPGYSEYRAYVPATATLAAVTSDPRCVWSLTTVSLDTTPASSAVGDSVERTITVSPPGVRTVQLIAKQEGMGTTTVAELQTDADGKATVYVPVLAGTVEWRADVVADFALGCGNSSGLLAVTGPLKPSGVAGWSTASSVLAPGATVTSTVEATISYAPRAVSVQYAPYGTSTWSTIATAQVDGVGQVSFTVRPGKNLYRLVVAPTATHAGVTTASRLITAKSRVTGFSTTTTTKAAGTIVKDGIVVTPGKYRTVKIQYRKGTSGAWTTYATRTTSSTGSITVSLKALRGTYSWRVYVPATTAHGTSAYTSPRVLKGV